jgi:hypothetical protein
MGILNQFTNEDQQLFNEIEADIKKDCTKYIEAGKWLDQFDDLAKFWQEKIELLQTLNEICKSHKECGCEFCEELEWINWVIEKRNFTSQDEYIEISDMDQEFREGLFKEEVPAIYRLLEAKSELISHYVSNCGMLSEKDAKCIYLINWLFTSPSSRKDTDVEITKFQRYELKDLEGIIYNRMGLSFHTQRDREEWINMVKTAQNRLGFEKEKDQTKNSLTNIEQICLRFHRVAIQLSNRHGSRETLRIDDEYDVQDLLHALLLIDFDDIRPEEWTPSYAGSSSRMDFLLKNEQIVIETKKTRNGLGAKEIGEQLIIDIEKYKGHPDCKTLVCFVYDPEGRIRNPKGIENDLNWIGCDLTVKVLIVPTGL